LVVKYVELLFPRSGSNPIAGDRPATVTSVLKPYHEFHALAEAKTIPSWSLSFCSFTTVDYSWDQFNDLGLPSIAVCYTDSIEGP
jgi:hypothetical protein